MSKEPEPRARGRAPRRVIDWHRAAEFLAQGMTVAAAAERIGCSKSALSRKRRHDPVFQNWLARCRQSPPGDNDGGLADLTHALHQAIEKEVHAGNVRVVLWLADRLKLVTPPNERTSNQELRAILRTLTPEELSEFEALRDEH